MESAVKNRSRKLFLSSICGVVFVAALSVVFILFHDDSERIASTRGGGVQSEVEGEAPQTDLETSVADVRAESPASETETTRGRRGGNAGNGWDWLPEDESGAGTPASNFTLTVYQTTTETKPNESKEVLPVEEISWEEAEKFREELTKFRQEGGAADLPEESQWEYSPHFRTSTGTDSMEER